MTFSVLKYPRWRGFVIRAKYHRRARITNPR